MNKPKFEVDPQGLAKLLERRGKAFALFELIQNAWEIVAKHRAGRSGTTCHAAESAARAARHAAGEAAGAAWAAAGHVRRLAELVEAEHGRQVVA